jgi:hypothetical protein
VKRITMILLVVVVITTLLFAGCGGYSQEELDDAVAAAVKACEDEASTAIEAALEEAEEAYEAAIEEAEERAYVAGEEAGYETCQQEELAGIATIEVTFTPNPVPCEGEHAHWTIIFTEVNGIGVELQSVTIHSYYGSELLHSRTYTASDMKNWWGAAHLPPYGMLSATSGYGDCSEITHEVVVVTGKDENDNVVLGEGRVTISWAQSPGCGS